MDFIVAATGGERTYVDTPEQLERALEYWVEYVAVESNIGEIVQKTNDGRLAISRALSEIGRENYGAAEDGLREVPASPSGSLS